ncbi:hypothetical protein M5G20_23780 [Pseudomonas sp. TNT2022 ID1044]|uniref:hypothetical protein n=1 Tax=Pseudomonas sp. TNT2022 ID1044 TaxID=2942636 RepID=UPI00235FA7FD|nr:hypothetical protein [Pseudomonas sp. TNT2022 ID1044]MDD0998863.1 hypothetical protein [Pseudomonas sp. TNT2022 ID1044]
MPWVDQAMSILNQGWFSILVGTIVAVVTYRLARQRTSLAYVYLGEHLLGSSSDSLPPAIVVQYNGSSIPRLTKSIIIIWNSGENTLSGGDIVDKDPLRFHIADGRILSLSVLKTGRAVNDFRILTTPGEDTNEVEFTFDFLDANDGAVVEILHTSTDRQPRIKGTLRGLPRGARNFGRFLRTKPRKKPTRGKIPDLLFYLGVAASGALFAASGGRLEFLSDLGRAGTIAASFLGGFAGMWATNWYFTKRKYPKSLHTEALE